MGFGIKTDFRTGRDIDLDKTYHNIIRPVFKKLGFLCYRADDIKHSGIIDIPMYENILKSDFVIVDISTLNPNVLYELGVRHAVRKSATLIIAEKELNYPFDLNHIIIDSYEHLGKAIDYDEVIRFRKLLREKVQELLLHPNTDSPLYSLFPTLNVPNFTQAEIKEIQKNIKEEKSVTDLVEEAEKCKSNEEYEKAISLLNGARQLLPRNEFIIQRLALVTYKSKLPDEGTALFKAETILKVLNPQKTTDPETLGLSGAINKRLYEIYEDKSYLDKSLWYYSRGFFIKQDYYNGINLAFLQNIYSTIEVDQFTSFAYYGNAIQTRKRVIEICKSIIIDSNFKSREDKHWIYLTISEAYYGINEFELAKSNFNLAMESGADKFSNVTYEEQVKKIKNLNSKFNTKWNLG
jgi:tetratricopeptide (TPR) repeat protein